MGLMGKKLFLFFRAVTLADMECSVVEARAWTHCGRLACVVFLRVEDADAGCVVAHPRPPRPIHGDAAEVPAAGVAHADRPPPPTHGRKLGPGPASLSTVGPSAVTAWSPCSAATAPSCSSTSYACSTTCFFSNLYGLFFPLRRHCFPCSRSSTGDACTGHACAAHRMNFLLSDQHKGKMVFLHLR